MARVESTHTSHAVAGNLLWLPNGSRWRGSIRWVKSVGKDLIAKCPVIPPTRSTTAPQKTSNSRTASPHLRRVVLCAKTTDDVVSLSPAHARVVNML